MSKRTRWILFFISVFLFVVLSYVTVVFALGYQYDFIARDFVRMGSFRVVTNTGADVYLNGKLTGDTSFLNNSFSKGRLLPRSYTVRIEKKGYHTWSKNIPVVAGYFTDIPKIVLLPLELESEIVPSGSFGFPVVDEVAVRERAVKGKLLTFDDHAITVEWTDGTGDQPYHQVGDVDQIALFPQKIDDVQWYKDREHIIVSTGGILLFLEIDDRGGINTYQLTANTGPFWYDKDSNVIYKIEGANIVKLKLG